MLYDILMEDRPEAPEIARAEETLSELLKRVEDRELREEIDRASGRVGYLRRAEGYAAGILAALEDR